MAKTTLWWTGPSQQLSTHPSAHSLPHPSRTGDRIGKAKARRLMGLITQPVT